MTNFRKFFVCGWLANCLPALSPIVAALRRPLVLAVLHVAAFGAIGQAITINFTYSHIAPHAEDQDGSKLKAITQAAAQYYEALLPQTGQNTTFTFDLRWENLPTGQAGIYRGRSSEVDQLAVNNNLFWYFDADPLDHSEFRLSPMLYGDLSASQQNDWFAGSPPGVLEVGYRGRAESSSDAWTRFDLFTTLLHEIGHGLGVNSGANVDEYAFPSDLIGGLDVAAKGRDGDTGHLAADSALMRGGGAARSFRRLPSATDLLAIAGRINAHSGSPVLPDLDRVDFIGTQSNDWNDPLNWVGGRVPNGEKDIFIRHGGSVSRSFPATFFTVGGTSGSAGALTVSDGSIWTNSGALRVGHDSAGTLTISSGGRVVNHSGIIGSTTSSIGEVTVTGSGSTWKADGLAVGSSGMGTLTIESGGAVSSYNGRIGVEAGSIGKANVIGPGSTWTSSSVLAVGVIGTGTLTIASGGNVSSSSGTIGDSSPSIGTVTVTGSTWINSGNLRVGRSGRGTLNIEDGGLVDVGGKLSINASSTVNLDGGTLRFDDYERAGTFNYRAGTVQLAGTRVVGTDAAINELFRTPTLFDDDRFLVQDDTAVFEADWSTSGDGLNFQSLTAIAASDANDTLATQDAVASSSSLYWFPTWLTVGQGKALVIEGATDIETDLVVSGGRLTSQSLASVGASGTGRLTVQGAGSVTTDSAIIGNALGAEGTVTVSGAGSTWTNSGSLDVGRNGSATLTIENGGTVSSASASVARRSGSTGAVRVSGANSNWKVAGNLSIGGHTSIRGATNGGAGEVKIGLGGSVNVTEDIVLLPDGLLKLDGGTLAAETIRFEAPREFDRFTQWGFGEGQFDWTSGTLHVGTFDGDLVNPDGTLAPGHSVGSTLITGNYEQHSSGVLAVEVDGTQGDQFELISIVGTATLDGVLDVSLIDGFLPQLGQRFEILSAGSVINHGLMLGGTAADLFDLLVDSSRVVLQAIGTAAPGDFNGDGWVDAADYTLWRDGLGGALDAARYSQWKTNFDAAERGVASVAMSGGPIAVPEPAMHWLLLGIMVWWRRGFHRRRTAA